MEQGNEPINLLASLMEEFDLESASLKWGETKVVFRKHPKPSAAVGVALATSGTPSSSSDELDEDDFDEQEAVAVPRGALVTSPMTGLYYESSTPGGSPLVRIGTEVQAGQTVAIIEAMKVFNEIPATASGRVVAILVVNGQVVQPGEALMEIDPS